MSNDFQTQWGFPSEIKTQLGAARYELRKMPMQFRSGRPKWACVFYDEGGNIISTRTAMELTSKRTGEPYHVCARADTVREQTQVRVAQARSSASTSEIQDLVYA